MEVPGQRRAVLGPGPAESEMAPQLWVPPPPRRHSPPWVPMSSSDEEQNAGEWAAQRRAAAAAAESFAAPSPTSAAAAGAPLGFFAQDHGQPAPSGAAGPSCVQPSAQSQPSAPPADELQQLLASNAARTGGSPRVALEQSRSRGGARGAASSAPVKNLFGSNVEATAAAVGDASSAAERPQSSDDRKVPPLQPIQSSRVATLTCARNSVSEECDV